MDKYIFLFSLLANDPWNLYEAVAMARMPPSLASELGRARRTSHSSTFALEERRSFLTGFTTYQSLQMTHCSNSGKSVHFLVFEWNGICRKIWTDCNFKCVAHTTDAFKEKNGSFPKPYNDTYLQIVKKPMKNKCRRIEEMAQWIRFLPH